jgi:hypothetical protein
MLYFFITKLININLAKMGCSKTSNGLKKVRYSRRPQRRRKAQKKRMEQQKVVIGQANLDRNDRWGIGQQRVTLSQLILPKPSQSG